MKRGEVWIVDFGPASGPEQAGVRPAVVVQDDAVSTVYPTIIVVPITTKMKRVQFPATVLLAAGEGGLPKDSVALCYQMQVRGKMRLMSRLGTLSDRRMAQIMDGVQIALGL